MLREYVIGSFAIDASAIVHDGGLGSVTLVLEAVQPYALK